jgi:glycosyltransferase involved in cell wall biosynthesis
MPKVSIIIPLHNSEDFIEETINSCLNQTHKDIEIIVVENGSTDASFTRVSNYNDPRLFLHTIPVANACEARNYGYKKASGALISFLDADDVLDPYKIQLQVKALSQLPAGWIASCAWAKFNLSIEDSKMESQPVWQTEDPVDWCVQSWMGQGMMIPSCWLIPKAVIECSGLWNVNLSLHDDGEFICRVLLASKGNTFVKGTQVYYRQVKNSLSRNNKSFKAAKSALEVYKSYQQTILNKADTFMVKQALAVNYRTFIYQYHPNYKPLLLEAKSRIKVLEISKIPLVGGASFKRLSKCIGFNTALKLRAFLGSSINLFKLGL